MSQWTERLAAKFNGWAAETEKSAPRDEDEKDVRELLAFDRGRLALGYAFMQGWMSAMDDVADYAEEQAHPAVLDDDDADDRGDERRRLA